MLIIDLETTGLNPHSDKIIEIAIGETEKEDILFHTVIKHPKSLIKNCFIVNNHPELLPESLASDIEEKDLEELLKPYLNQDWTAFNVEFEFPFLQKYGFKRPNFCLMQEMKPICAIPHDYYGIKYPTLAEAFYYVNDDTNIVFHRASGDVQACFYIYQYLKKIGNI